MAVVFSSIGMVTAFEDNSTEILSQNEIYVCDNTNPDVTDGSFDSPYNSLSEAISLADNDSTIVMFEGDYKGELNTGLTVDKNITLKSYNSSVTINGENINSFFKIQKSSSLTIKDIEFKNGYADSSKLAVFENSGDLTLRNVTFNNMNSFMGVILNKGNLNILNSSFYQAKSSLLAQLIVNLENATLTNAIIPNNPSANLPASIYNYKNINIKSSDIDTLYSNLSYDDSDVHELKVNIDNSTFNSIHLNTTAAEISNSTFLQNTRFYSSKINVNSSRFTYKDHYLSTLSSFESNLTVKSSLISGGINCPNSIINITYSVIIDGISGNGLTTHVYAPYNWWGSNKGPEIEYANKTVDNWIVMQFEADESPISVGTDAKFTVSLNKIISKNTLADLPNPELVPQRYVKFESESGFFEKSGAFLENGIAENHLIDNTEDSLVYAVVDSQRLRLVIGTGSTNYTLYVSSARGSNALGDGSFENPYQTLKFALDKAITGNTIYLLEGNYSYGQNNELTITKNISIVGIGNPVLKRDDNRVMFSVSDIGSLRIENITFSVLSKAYGNSLFILNGGSLTIINSTFTNITSSSIIESQSYSNVKISHCNFTDNRGSVISGSLKAVVDDSIFENNRNYYENSIYFDFNYIFPVNGILEVYSSVFNNNTLGIANLHPTIQYSALSASFEYSSYAYFKNSSFTNNQFKNLLYPYLAFAMHTDYSEYGGFIDNCSFVNNTPLNMNINNLTSSVFRSNRLSVTAVEAHGSYFENNDNLVREGSYYVGEGILNAKRVINSTFISNKAAYGGALYNPGEVHYCVFVNNTAQYEGDDIFSYSGDVNYSSNWWGDNQKPDSGKVYIFLGNLIMDDWIVMTFENISKNTFEASLKLMSNNQTTSPLNYNINQRNVYFSTQVGEVTPQSSKLENNRASTTLHYDEISRDFKVYAQIDNQILDLSVRNNSTQILMNNVTLQGRYNKYNFTLINVNGYAIPNQTVKIEIINSTDTLSFNVLGDENGFFEIPFEYPSGEYKVNAYYEGNGYYEKSQSGADVNVVLTDTYINSLNYTFYGKNNDFYAVLLDGTGRGILNQSLTFTITNSRNQSKIIKSATDTYGRADIVLDLDVGNYTIQVDFKGDEWYGSSSSISKLTILPVNSTIILPNITLYGFGNVYNITLTDAYGTLIKGENIEVVISKDNVFDTFTLQSDDMGTAHLTINYLPGTYQINATYRGDLVYGSAQSSAVITVEKVKTTLLGFSHAVIPLNGYYSVVLSDMYGRRLADETVTMDVYKGKLLKSYSAVTDGNGEAVFKMDLGEDTYLVTYSYNGSTWYGQSTGAATVVISNDTVPSDIEMNGSDLIQYYGEGKYFIITFSDNNSFTQYGKNISATITSTGFSQNYNLITDIYGQARLQINLNPGVYNISYSYKNDYYNIYCENSNTITVYKMPSFIMAGDVIVKKNETKYIEVYLRDVNNNPIKNMPVNINGYNVTTNSEGIARLLINMSEGKHSVKYSFVNPNYISSEGSCEVLVTDSDKISTFLKGDDITTNESGEISYNVSLKDELANGISASKITVKVYDADADNILNLSANTDSEGIAYFKLNLTYGKYILKSFYAGSERYLESNTFNYLTVDSAGLVKTFITGYLDKNNTYKVTLVDDNANKIKSAEIRFDVNNKTYFTTTDDEGAASVYLGTAAGIFDIKALFDAEGYEKSSLHQTIYISGVLTYLFAPDIVKYYNNATQFKVQLLDSLGQPLSGKEIIFTVNNINSTNVTDELGWALMSIDFKPGNYTLISTYLADDSSENALAVSNVTVLSTILADNLVKYYRNASQFSAKFLYPNGQAIKNTNVSMLFDNTSYIRMTDENGIATLVINSEVGKYNISVQNPYDGLVESYNITVLPYSILKESILNGQLIDNIYRLILTDADNKSIANAEITVIIENNTYFAVTDSQGIVNVELPKEFGIYHLNAIFKGDSAFKQSTFSDYFTVSGNLTFLLADNLVKFYRNASQFNARLVDADNNPLSGKAIKLQMNGKNYTRVTDSNGWIKFDVNLNPGEYDIICAYYSDNPLENTFSTSKITVLPTIIGFDLVKYYMNASQFYAKIIDGKGDGIAGRDVVMNINGVFYTRKSNDLGIVKLNINLLPNLYIITVTNPNDGLKASFTVTVLSTVQSGDLVKYYRNASQFYVRLLDDTGNPLKNAQVSMNINGVIYTRQTDGSGTAKLNINLGPGEYILTTTHPSGLQVSNKITVLSILEGSDLIINHNDGGVFKVILLDSTGRPFAGQQIVFNINGVMYKRNTDSNGVASLNINLPVGKYIISSCYGDFAVSNTIIIN